MIIDNFPEKESLNVSDVSDDTNNDAIKCDHFDEHIENNKEIHIEEM